MYVKIQQDDGEEVERFGVNDFKMEDGGKVIVWYDQDANLDDRKEPIEGVVVEALCERSFEKKWEAKEAIESSARSEADVKVVTTRAHPQIERAAVELKQDEVVADGFTLIA